MSVCLSRSSPCRNHWTDRDAVWVVYSRGPKEPCIRFRWAFRSRAKEQYWGEKGRPIIKYKTSAVSCVKTAEPIQMLFGMWTQMALRKHVLGGAWGCTLAQSGEHEPSMCGGDVAFLSNDFDHLSWLSAGWLQQVGGGAVHHDGC